MVTVYDVPSNTFINSLARYLKDNIKELTPPEWFFLVKTGVHTERPPENLDWWYIRAASIMRKLYINGPIGIERLRTAYGGRVAHYVVRPHAKKGSSSNIRKILQQLEKAGLVRKVNKKGRELTPLGKSIMDRIATKVFRELVKSKPELKKYAFPEVK